jgi:hypothetical protein
LVLRVALVQDLACVDPQRCDANRRAGDREGVGHANVAWT